MSDKHGQYKALYPVVGLDVSAANKYDPPNTDPYDEAKFLSHLNYFIFRLTLSKYRDMDAMYHAGLVARHNITAWGGYVAPKIGRANWKEQADAVATVLGQLRSEWGTALTPPMKIWVDVERRSLDPSVSHTKLSVTEWVRKYVDRLSSQWGEENLGIYTGLVWNELTYKTDRFKNLDLFHAQYNDYVPAPTTIARDWADHNNLVKKWKLWQWAAEGYKIDGLTSGKHVGVHSAYVDLGRWNGTEAEFEKHFGCKLFHYQGEVPPDPIPPIPEPPDPEPSGYPIGFVNTSNLASLWTHSEPNTLTSTRNGFIGHGQWVVIEDARSIPNWYLLKDSGQVKKWVYAPLIKILEEYTN